MRFCMVTTFYPPYHFGGDATYVRALSRALVARGHEVEVVHCEDAYRAVSRDERSLSAPVEEDGIRVHRLRSRFGMLSPLITQQTGRPGLKRRALREILARDFDVVNFHNVSLIGGPGVLALSQAPVTLYTAHEHWLLCPTHIFWKNRGYACDRPQCLRCSLRSGIPPQLWRYTGLIRRSLAHVDTLLAPSAYTAERHRAAGVIREIQVLPLFSILNPGTLPAPVPRPRPFFLYVGRVTASKGVVPLLEYFARYPALDLCIVGDGDLRAALSQRYADRSHISFAGYVPQAQLVDLYRRATAVVLPSLAPETFGLSVVEAFACGTPAIVRDAGGSRETIDNTGAGFVYRTDEEFHQVVQRFAGDPSLRIQLGQLARAGFERWYTPERHVAGYLECIARIRTHKNIAGHA